MKINRIEKYEVTGVVINMQNTTIFKPVILTVFYIFELNTKDFARNSWTVKRVEKFP